MKPLGTELTQRREKKLYRFRRIAEQSQLPELTIDGQTLICFCSNDYLGLANDSEVQKSFIKGAQTWGVGSGGAHLINGHTQAHHQLEQELAEFTGRDRALLFSTGYMANLGTIQALAEKNDIIFQDRLNHASLLDAGKLSGAKLRRYPHSSTQRLCELLQNQQDSDKFIVSDGIFSMDGDIAPLNELAKLAHTHNATLMIDDAHGLGVLGTHGGGCLDLLSLTQKDVPILMGTLGKALGTFGAFIAGNHHLIETLIQTARPYIYTTAMPAAIAEATRTSLTLIQTQSWRREKLHNNIKQFRSGAEQLGIPIKASPTPIQTIIVGSSAAALAMSEQLLTEGLLVTAIRPPTVPKHTARLRITLSSSHNSTHIEQLLIALSKVSAQLAKS